MPTMVKQDKFTFDLRERIYYQYNFLYMNAKKIIIEFNDGSSEWINLDNKNLDQALERIMKERMENTK